VGSTEEDLLRPEFAREVPITSERAESKTFRLSGRLSITFTVGLAGIVCEWNPRMRALDRTESRAYCAARDEMMQRLANLIDGKVLTVELGTGRRIVHAPKR
jgi:hypothetical protein